MNNNSSTSVQIFPWDSNFEIGIEIIDEQHKQLVNILNKLASHLTNYSDEVTLNETFTELVDYTDYHFQTEEKIWSQYLSDDEYYKSHLITHASFIEELLKLKNNRSTKSHDENIYSIISFLSKWLAYHILDTDKNMANIIHAMEKGASIGQAKIDAKKQVSSSKKLMVNAILSMYDNLSNRTLDLMREKSLRRIAEEALSASEERWKFILDGGIENAWDWDIEHNKQSHTDNETSLFQHINKHIEGNESITVHPADAEELKADFEAHINGETDFYTNKHRALRKNGSWSWVLSRGKVVSRDNTGKALRMVGTHSDITEREIAAQIYQNSNQAIFVTDMNNKLLISILNLRK